jgi:two-component system chemotaxis response regulator CheB
MAQRPSQKRGSTSAGRLRRSSERQEQTGRTTELPLANVIVIGASAGGHKALWELVREISPDIPAAVIIMQHMAQKDDFGSPSFSLDDWLRDATRALVVPIHSGERVRASVIYVCPAGMSVSLKGRTLHLAPVQRAGPISTINILFQSAARAFSDRVIGVILTGLLKDGTAGLKAVHDAGGVTIVQDPAEAEYPDMPASAMKELPVTFSLKLADIGPTLDLLARRKSELETGLAVSVRTLKERVALLVRLITQSKKNPETQQFLSAEMIALELDLRSIQALLDHALVEESRRRRPGGING